MRLVHDEEADAALQQPLEELAVLEPLGREVQDRPLAPADPLVDAAGLASVRCECIAIASTPWALSLSCWSFMRAMSGLTTTVSPSSISAGNW